MSPRHALAALLLFALLPNPITAQPLGRLFFTPEQRALLDQQSPAPPSTSPHPDQDLRLDGVVKRSDGRHTVWINGRMQGEEPLARHQPDLRQPMGIRLLIDRESVPLKVGDTWQKTDGKVRPLLSPTP